MQDGPEAFEIVDAVISFLNDEILPILTGSEAFKLRVAINALRLINREILIDPQDVLGEQQALESFLGQEGEGRALVAELARRLRQGEIGTESKDLHDLLWRLTEAKLNVDQPRYAGLELARKMRSASN